MSPLLDWLVHTAPDDEVEGSIAQGPGPKSLLDDIDWNVLGARVGGEALQLGRYKLCCFLNNKVNKKKQQTHAFGNPGQKDGDRCPLRNQAR